MAIFVPEQRRFTVACRLRGMFGAFAGARTAGVALLPGSTIAELPQFEYAESNSMFSLYLHFSESFYVDPVMESQLYGIMGGPWKMEENADGVLVRQVHPYEDCGDVGFLFEPEAEAAAERAEEERPERSEDVPDEGDKA